MSALEGCPLPVKRFAFALLLVTACGTSTKTGFAPDDGGAGDATTQNGDGSTNPSFGSDSGIVRECGPGSPDMEGCSCGAPGQTQACYTGDPKTRHVGNCKDGAQTCVKQGEFGSWGPCTGSYTPSQESCIGNVDTNCNGKIGCQDPQCATNPACQTGCTNGETRACYDGPAGTENVGACKDGKQTCVLPAAAENCCGALDANCNGAPGCFDFACLLPAPAACCQSQCTSPLDTGCVCPKGSGDTQTCPDGDHVVHKGGFPGSDECCPCNDCNDINCCGNAVCAGSSTCSGLTCKPLPPSCNGRVDTDCDDFPEDCDEPCCKCTNCP